VMGQVKGVQFTGPNSPRVGDWPGV